LPAAAARVDPGAVADVDRLRQQWPADDVAAALSLADARRRLATKFADANSLWADREAAEQATSATVASWKAERFRRAGAQGIEDRCSGMGGDTMSLALVAPTIGVDASDVRAWMTSINAKCETVVGDATDPALRAEYVHFDPARRDEAAGRRQFELSAHSPPVDVCFAISRAARGAAVKLGPGLPLPMPAALGAERDGELEFLSEGGRLVQTVCWFGTLASSPGERSATMLPERLSLSGRPNPVSSDVPLAGAFGRYLYVANPALERAELLGVLARRFNLAERAPGLGVLTSDEEIRDPWLTGYEIVARPRPREADVARELAALGASGARVRTRGRSADADAWTKALRNRASGSTGVATELDVFLLRAGTTLEAIVARPIRD